MSGITLPNPGGHEFLYTRRDFLQVRQVLYRRTGISLSESKEQLVYSRLSRRLRALRLDSFGAYLAYLAENDEEWQQFVNALTTNLTAFFRERHHFDTLATLARDPARRHRPLRFWSSASSTGEEPYSMAMTLVEAFGSFQAPVQILASDIDTRVLETARQGIYPLERVESLELARKQRFFQRGSGPNAGKVRVVPELRQLVEFQQINLLDARWDVQGEFDAIFCRNVMIYFDKPTQTALLERLVRLLRPDGLFFAGHSENFVHAGHLVRAVGRSTYQRVAAR
ncbi:CheR family methyltransferase [Pseudomonas knackmussii]|uniref:CheR family methyltransferase n=1 Tax=Pseudomonas knackmussii TaxID=65741 RepID=UPI0013620BED|nr:CheR family methyltransferase [Pseudomonas knackmussii]